MRRLHSPSNESHTSRRALLRTAGRATLAAGATLAVTQASPVAAQDDAAATLIGSWIVNAVNPAPGAVSNGTFVSFTPGGGFSRAGISHPTESPGYGAWKQVGDAEFEFTYQVIQFDKQGNFIGHRKAWGHLILDPSGMSWTAPQTRGALIDPNGVETATPPLPGGIRGDRMIAEPTSG
jgi:hypothetical protein